MTRAAHVPVLLDELVGVLDPQPGETAVDCTFGAGGHARAVGNRLGPTGTLIAIDRDPIAEERFSELAADVPCHTRFIRASFAEGLEVLAEEGTEADLAFLDLGMSSMQLDTLERGFSYVYDAPLDMRMDPEQELTARDVINGWDERGLVNTFKELGEERYARQIARAIVRRRRKKALETTQELVDVISSAIPAP
ncbi:MAG TPA: 16S rRNA (cytosine(1402)-N(4))-methyltransferase RsmH, partial [Solirubrobacteraceae bacterium]|nr:16S rRNA (cytosine(1402)-N(4))-methyltransferase RsmH [Solirubrobacteraceae bacterium]